MYKKNNKNTRKKHRGGGNTSHKKFPPPCKQNMTFEECEIAIVRSAVEELEHAQLMSKMSNSPEINRIMEIVENFIRTNKVILYGGAAINGILPKHSQFYNYKSGDIPDYDFFSPTAMLDSIRLADIFYAAGYTDVETKSGVHYGTYKVFVSQIPVADCTQQHPIIFNESWNESIVIDGIHYSSANWLRMGAYIELSRPLGDVSRYEKVVKRLSLLNKFHPMEIGIECYKMDFQRKMEEFNEENSKKIFNIMRDTFINEEAVFFGSYAVSLYSDYMPEKERKQTKKAVDFDVCTENIDRTSRIVIEKLHQNGFTSARIIKHTALGEILPKHNEIRIGKYETVAFIFEPSECINYNILEVSNIPSLKDIMFEGTQIRVATIDTILRFYLAFIYTKRAYFDKNRLLCMANFLFRVQEENRLEQRGLLKRFSINCVGKQTTLEAIRAEKAEKYTLLKKNKNNIEYYRWFLKYQPAQTNYQEKSLILLAAKSYIDNNKETNLSKKNKTFKYNKQLRFNKERTLSSVGYKF